MSVLVIFFCVPVLCVGLLGRRRSMIGPSSGLFFGHKTPRYNQLYLDKINWTTVGCPPISKPLPSYYVNKRTKNQEHTIQKDLFSTTNSRLSSYMSLSRSLPWGPTHRRLFMNLSVRVHSTFVLILL